MGNADKLAAVFSALLLFTMALTVSGHFSGRAFLCIPILIAASGCLVAWWKSI